ncbi:SRPBCC family protein [Nocardia sp. NPDC051030]|uniref:SRPBCC family protein n=1 Tax=Nocardia sp. NPDC051030 TaxID=3155162 RepID=UPI00343B7303
MVTFAESGTITGDIEWIWRTASDPAAWASWDPHLEEIRFEGPFAPGSTGWSKPKGGPGGPFTVVATAARSSYSTESPVPGGLMKITNTYTELGDGQVRITRDVEVTGWFGKVFNLFWAKGQRRDMHNTFRALEQEAQRRAATSVADI